MTIFILVKTKALFTGQKVQKLGVSCVGIQQIGVKQMSYQDIATPYDILENGYVHYSKSKDEYIDLLDLQLVHFIRIFLKQVDEYNLVKTKFEKTNEYINDDNNNIKELGQN